ncbi:MAG: ABC transporter permease [Steroidobacteraceae bacterium]
MSAFRQIAAVVVFDLRTLPQRARTSFVIVIGIAGVVAVLISVLSLSTGLVHALTATGRPDRAIVLHKEASNEVSSSLPRQTVFTLLEEPGIARDAAGKPIASAETLASINIPRRDSGAVGALTLRGISPQAFELRPEIRLTAGRAFKPGLRELIAGSAAQERYRGLAVGSRIRFDENEWTVVGAFTSGGGMHDSELLADADTVLAAYHRTVFNSVTVKLDGPGALTALNRALSTDSTLQVSARTETQYYEQESKLFGRLLAFISYFVGAIMAVGAVFAALNTMYSAVSARTTEIATLRAIGFGAAAVVASVLVEALLLALFGALIGAAAAWIGFDGNTVGTLSGGNDDLAQVIFHLRIGPGLIAIGILCACIVGLIGGLLPALRAARVPVAMALQA